jgi:hypothetical protein
MLDIDQKYMDTTLVFCMMVKDDLLQNKLTPAVKERIKDIDFIIDELSIKLLEECDYYEC